MTSSMQGVDGLCEQARHCLKQRDAASAIRLYEQALEQNPDHIPAYEGLAGVCFALKDYDRAVENFQRLIALDPRNAAPLVNLGAAYNRQGKFQEAVKVLRQAMARDRRCAEAYYNLGTAQRGLQQLSMAVSAFKETIRLSPEMYDAYVNLGQVLLEMGNPTQAVLNFERALQLKANLPRAQHGLMLARQRIDDAKKAISPFGRLVDEKEVARKAVMAEVQFRELSPQERFEDRRDVHRLAKESEQCSVALFNQLKNELSPAILHLSKLVSNEKDPATWGDSFEHLELSLDRFRKFSEITFRKTDELRTHEKEVRGT